MKIYRVTMRMVTLFEIGVTAKTAAAAIETARNTELERFTEEIDGTSYKVRQLSSEDPQPRRWAHSDDVDE